MKIWYQHGSEHSANLVMIGHFEDVTEATKAEEVIDAISKQVAEEERMLLPYPSSPPDWLGDARREGANTWRSVRFFDRD
jgi:hypothetical protein